jgi:hypothetical protein
MQHMHANQIRRATLVTTSLALAPVLATSKLLGMMENNGEIPQKSEAPYQSQSNPGFKTATADTRQYVSAVYVSAVYVSAVYASAI